MVVLDKKKKKAVIIDVAMPNDDNIKKKEHDKIKKYQGVR